MPASYISANRDRMSYLEYLRFREELRRAINTDHVENIPKSKNGGVNSVRTE